MEGEDRAILKSELSKTVFLGVSYVLARLATTPDGKPLDKASQICQDVINDLAEMGVETAKNTLSLRSRQEAAEKEAADKAEEETAARAAAIAGTAWAEFYAEHHQTGPFRYITSRTLRAYPANICTVALVQRSTDCGLSDLSRIQVGPRPATGSAED